MRLLYLALALVVTTTGCKVLFPSEARKTKNAWKTFDEAQAAFDKVVPHETTGDDLSRLGFDPQTTANVRILTYLDIIERFIPNDSIQLEDLQEDVRNCIGTKDGCRAYELNLDVSDSERYGNLFLDVFGFNKKTHITGWNFRGLIVLQGDVVIYKLRSGQPYLDKLERKSKPLGPFQELDNLVSKMPRL